MVAFFYARRFDGYETEAEKRKHRCCFTGHRPEKLQEPEGVVTAALEKEIRQAIADGFNVFITGMARGVDIWAAEIVLRLQDAGEAVRLICACPYQGFERGWKQSWQERYQAILSAADLVRFTGRTSDSFVKIRRCSSSGGIGVRYALMVDVASSFCFVVPSA